MNSKFSGASPTESEHAENRYPVENMTMVK